MTKWRTLSIASAGPTLATVVFVAPDAAEPIGPQSQKARVAVAIASAAFDPQGGRWLDLLGDSETRIVVIGIGERSNDRWLSAGGHLVDVMRQLRLASVLLPANADLEAGALQSLLTGSLLHSYRLDQGRREVGPGFQPEQLVIDPGDMSCADQAQIIADPINRARAWIEQPANLLTPAIFADEAEAALTARGLSVRVLGPTELETLGANLTLAVGRASEHEPRLVIAEWRGAPERDSWDAALIGKGLTYDSGGLNLKTRPIIEKMKFDMGGAAAVLGAIELAAARKARVNVVAVVPMAENAVGGRAVRPGDVVRSLSGLTVEIVNTDAEGRLVLAEAMTYAIDKYAPASLVDVATLTGMITGVLHEEYAGLYTADDALADALLQAGTDIGEPLWRMPLSPSQRYLVDSPVADVSNFGAGGYLGAGGGSSTAAAQFLSRFAGDAKWAHIDIAGTAWATRRTARSGPGATGAGVAMLDRWLAGLEDEA